MQQLKIKDCLIARDALGDNPGNFTAKTFYDKVDAAVDMFRSRVAAAEADWANYPEKLRVFKAQAADALSADFGSISEEFRRDLLKVSPKSKKRSVFAMSCSGVSLKDVAKERIGYMPNGRPGGFVRVEAFVRNDAGEMVPSALYARRGSAAAPAPSKPNFSSARFIDVAIPAVAMAFRKYSVDGRLCSFLLTAQLYKTLITIFDLGWWNAETFDRVVDRILDTPFAEVEAAASAIGLKERRTRARKPKRTMPTAADYAAWQDAGMSQYQIQSQLARQFGISLRTVQRDMARKGVTEVKYSPFKSLETNEFAQP